MDCRTARLLQEFVHPSAAELEAGDWAALETHLAGCSECDAAYRLDQANDARLRKAMLAVTVPEGLQKRLTHRLMQERNTVQRRWLRRGAAAAAIAASLFLCVFIALGSVRPLPDVGMLGDSFIRDTSGNPETVATLFKETYRLEVQPPPGFNYQLLAYCGVVEHKKRVVPVFVFARTENNITYFARVFLLSDKDFDLRDLSAEEDSKGVYRTHVLPALGGPAYLVLYTGDRLDGFLLHNPTP